MVKSVFDKTFSIKSPNGLFYGKKFIFD